MWGRMCFFKGSFGLNGGEQAATKELGRWDFNGPKYSAKQAPAQQLVSAKQPPPQMDDRARPKPPQCSAFAKPLLGTICHQRGATPRYAQMRPDTLKEAWKFGACLSRMRAFRSWTPIRTPLKEVVGGSGVTLCRWESLRMRLGLW